MLDGYPIYGPYGYASSTNKTIKQMITGYRLRTDMNTSRTTLLDCSTGTCITTSLNANTQCGPPISTTYPLGNLIQDYVWKSGNDLGILKFFYECFLFSNKVNLKMFILSKK